jgi:hypothetical protein
MSKLSKSTRSLKSVVNNRDNRKSEDEDIHLKDLSPETLEAEPASQQNKEYGKVKSLKKYCEKLFSHIFNFVITNKYTLIISPSKDLNRLQTIE